MRAAQFVTVKVRPEGRVFIETDNVHPKDAEVLLIMMETPGNFLHFNIF